MDRYGFNSNSGSGRSPISSSEDLSRSSDKLGRTNKHSTDTAFRSRSAPLLLVTREMSPRPCDRCRRISNLSTFKAGNSINKHKRVVVNLCRSCSDEELCQ